jgi:hypothetical protein
MRIDDPKVLLDRWYSAPIRKLECLPHGDGAIAGVMIVLPLFERYIHIKKSKDTSGRNFYQIMADEVGLPSPQVAEEFWKTFRHGFCHTGMPFEEDRNQNPLPSISFRHDYPKFPQKVKGNNNNDVFIIDPWKFIHHVHDIYLADPTLLEQHPQAPLLPIHILV